MNSNARFDAAALHHRFVQGVREHVEAEYTAALEAERDAKAAMERLKSSPDYEVEEGEVLTHDCAY